MRLLAAVSGLIIYGSLYPFDIAAPDDPAGAIRGFLSNGELWTSRGDVLGNIALFIPFGMVGVYGAAPGPARTRAVLLTIGGGLLLAFLIQVMQIWIQSRSAVLSDVFWNGVGIVAGAAGGVALRSSAVFRQVRAEGRLVPPIVLLGLWLLSELAPLVPSIDAGGIRRSVAFVLRRPSIEVELVLLRAAQVVLAGRLLADIVPARLVHGALLAVVAVVVIGKVLFIELELTWTIVAGLGAGLALWALLTSRAGPRVPSAVTIGLLLVAYGIYALHPFVTRPPEPFLWIPFASVLDGWMLTNVRALTMTTATLGGCLWLLRERGWAPFPSTAAVAGFALALEICQMWIPGRTPSSTEPALAVLTGWALSEMRRPSATAPSSRSRRCP
jgi:VanZ family protein